MTDVDFRLRRDIAGVIHWELNIPGRNMETWTPSCQPNTDWINLIDDIVWSGGPTCLWCAACRRVT